MFRAIDKWLVPYLVSRGRRPQRVPGPVHVMVAVCDHFEPLWPCGQTPEATAGKRLDRWLRDYPRLAADFTDCDGRHPCHTFFYPDEEYRPAFVQGLAELGCGGWGEVEVHLHHRHDSPDGLRQRLERYRQCLRTEHGLLGSDVTGRPSYGFIHGNWALCNSRPDGDWCGVDAELTVLAETGCYADFTFPSAPSPTQPRVVNALYYASDRPGQRRGHDRGIEAGVRPDSLRAASGEVSSRRGLTHTQVGTRESDAAIPRLLLVQGPLELDWASRKWWILPRLDTAAVSAHTPPGPRRVRLWLRPHIHVRGRPDWVFVKLHTHGCQEASADMLLGDSMRRLHEHLCRALNDGTRYCLHYVSARELVNLVHAAEAGAAGPPGNYRDFVIAPPPCVRR